MHELHVFHGVQEVGQIGSNVSSCREFAATACLKMYYKSTSKMYLQKVICEARFCLRMVICSFVQI